MDVDGKGNVMAPKLNARHVAASKYGGGPARWYVDCSCCGSEYDPGDLNREDAVWMAKTGECYYCADECEECAS